MSVDYKTALFIAQEEALCRQAYRNPGDVWTWSIGLTSATGHIVDRYIGKPQSLDHCLRVYVWALDNYLDPVRKMFPDAKPNELAGIGSWCWNLGYDKLQSASWVRHYKSGDMVAAEKSFKQWRMSNGKVNPALAERRAREADIIFRNVWPKMTGQIVEYTRVKSSGAIDWASGKTLDISDALRRATSGEVVASDKVAVPTAPEAMQRPWWQSKEVLGPLVAGGGLTGAIGAVGTLPWQNLAIICGVAFVGLAGFLLWRRHQERESVT